MNRHKLKPLTHVKKTLKPNTNNQLNRKNCCKVLLFICWSQIKNYESLTNIFFK